MPIDIEGLLKPISPEQPSGADLRYAPVTSEIKEARRQEDDISQGVWTHPVKTADYIQSLKLCTQVLTKRSKDLQIAAWLTEALLAREGFPGLLDGLHLIRRLLEDFWDTIHPQIDEDGDLEMRATPLRWVGFQLDTLVRSVPLTQQGIGWLRYKESRTVPSQEEANINSEKSRVRSELLAEGRLAPEVWEKAFQESSRQFYEKLSQELTNCIESVRELSAFCDQKFPDEPPDFNPLIKSLEEVHQTVHILNIKKGSGAQPAAAPTVAQEKSPPSYPAPSQEPPLYYPDPSQKAAPEEPPLYYPDPAAKAAPEPPPLYYPDPSAKAAPEPPPLYYPDPSAKAAQEPPPLYFPDSSQPVAAPVPSASTGMATAARLAPTFSSGPEPADPKEAFDRIAAAAHYLRRCNANNPVPYLVLRALRWGEIRAGGAHASPTLAEGPSSETRVLLRRLTNEVRWDQLIEAAESAMAEPCGRAWLDLQRYVVRACRFTGNEEAANAIVSELKALLFEYPQLLDWTLTDDTPAANPETRQWLREEKISGAPLAIAWAQEPPPRPSPESLPEEEPPDTYELALQAARSGRTNEAFALLHAEAQGARSGRDRFVRKTQLAQICLATGNESIALPILRDLVAEIERRHLDEWEDSELIGLPLQLLYNCLTRLGTSGTETQELHARLCRVDPARALSLAK
jgi:type VI secretion system protein ImpA